MFVPSLLLKQLYTFRSLKNTPAGVEFSVKNRLSDAELAEVVGLKVDGQPIPLEAVRLRLADGTTLAPADLAGRTVPFPLRAAITLAVSRPPLAIGKHKLEIAFKANPFGQLSFEVEDAIAETDDGLVRIPRDPADDYGPAALRARQAFVEQQTGVKLEHLTQLSWDPHRAKGNIENLTWVAQVPLGFAGPIHINGEHAQGQFLVPLATSEGTLVASYNRGIKVLNLCGGVKCTVVADAMQRAPVFVFDDARGAREFLKWVEQNLAKIREEAEASSSVAKLLDIDPYLASKFAYLRFNYATGDAAGQNMVGRATFAACSWIIDHYPGIRRFYLESNFATDKKASQVNIMRTRGKRVTAEATIPRDVLIQNMRVEPE
ncbi:MAG: hypothetical protein JNK29_19510, partial [Anaerolineales bacterium]|nr:hypothetical protein [Anaerolineales bacterium]